MRTHPPARQHRCRTCRRTTHVGLDDDQAAFTATTDPTPLTPLGEAIALLAGLHTYLHDPTGRLWRRTRYDITTRPADATNQAARLHPGHIVADHHCGIDLTAYRTTSPSPDPMPAANPMADTCPY